MTIKAEHVEGERFRVRVFLGTHPETGHPIQKTRYFRARNQREANKVAAVHEVALRHDQQEAKEQRGTVTELVDLWVKHRASQGDSPATIYRRRSIVTAIRRDLGRIKVDKLTPLQIDQWLNQLRTENVGQGSTPKYRSESTIHHYFRVLRAMLYQGYVWEMTERTPQKRVTKPKVRRHARVNAPPVATVRLLLDHATPDLAVAAAVLAATGLRRGELCALQWTDVDLDLGVVNVTKSLVALPKGRVLVKQPKTDESVRQVEIDPTTVYVLDQHRRRWEAEFPDLKPDAYLFPDPLSTDRTGHTPRNPDWLSRAWRALCDKHGAEIRLHDLRHWHASTLLDRGVPVVAVAGRLGHAKTSTTTDIYGQVVQGAGRAAATAIESAMRPP